MSEWPLYVFTLAIQAAVGGCILMTIYNVLLKKVLAAEVLAGCCQKCLTAFSTIAVIGMALTFFNIGYPRNALNAILNIQSSWLSREIAFTVIFIGLLLITTALSWRTHRQNQNLLIICSLWGLVTIFAMAALYNFTIFTAWSNINTFVGFYCSALILGAIVVIVAFLPALQAAPAAFAAVKMPTVVLVLAVFMLQFIFNTTFGSIAPGSSVLTLIRWTCSAVAAILLVYLYSFKDIKFCGAVYASLTVMLFGELVGRYLFYLPIQ